MSTQIPPTAAPALSVAPVLLQAAAHPLMLAAAALRSAAPDLTAVWAAAARAVSGQRTGRTLELTQAGMIHGLGSCVQGLEGIGSTLQEAAHLYRDCDDQALAASRSTGSHS